MKAKNLIAEQISQIKTYDSLKEELSSSFEEVLNIDEKTIKSTLKLLGNSNRILFIGHSPLQQFAYPLQTILTCNSKAAFAPLNYDMQEKLISEMSENDLIFVHTVSESWLQNEIVYSLKEKLSACTSKKIFISFDSITHTEDIKNSTKIILGKNAIPFGEVQVLLFYKILSILYAEKDL